MSDTTTLNVRMDTDTKNALLAFCDEVGISASALMNMFAKAVVRNQQVPFPVTSRPLESSGRRFERLFPRNESELDLMLTAAEHEPLESCVPAEEAFGAFERRMGW